MYVLNANHISKSYKTAGETMRILQNVNLQVMKGEMVAIMGPSGSGKTTLLHVLTGVDTPDDGEIVIGGETFSQLTEEEKAFFRRKHMGMIFQDFRLIVHRLPAFEIQVDGQIGILEFQLELDGSSSDTSVSIGGHFS